MNKLELLKQKLEQARKELNEKGYHYSPEMYSKGGYNELMKIKPFEIAYQNVIEEIWPDEAWWKVTNYWDIFDAMAFEGLNDETVIDEIIKHVDSSFLEESCELKEDSDESKSIKELESKYKCKFETGHKLSDWMRKYHEEYDNGELWDYSLEDFKSGAVEPQESLVYYLIKDADGELRAYETTEFCEECSEGCKSLKEGTSNFGWLRRFPLLVFYTYDEIMDRCRYDSDYPQLEDFTEDKGNGDFHVDYDAYYEACDKFEEEYWDKIETAVLDEDQVEQLEDAIYDFNEETKRIAEDLYDAGNEDDYYVLKDIQLKVEPGYYEAAYIDVDDEKDFEYLSDEVKEAQLKRFKEFFDKLKNEHHLSHYEVAWGPASNGETGYRKVESVEEDYDDGFEDEAITDMIIRVLDDYGITYGDVVEYEETDTVNIVGVLPEEYEEAQDAIQTELKCTVDIPSGEEGDDELIVHIGSDLIETKKKDCHVNTNAGDPIKNAEFFNANMGTSGEGAVGEDLKEELTITADNTSVIVHDDASVEVSNDKGIVSVSGDSVSVNTEDASVVADSSNISVDVSKSAVDAISEPQVDEIAPVESEVAPEEVVSGELVTSDTAGVPEIDSQDTFVSDEESADVEISDEVKEESLEEKHVCEKCGKEVCECDKRELKEEPVVNLDTRYDNANSFYGKAKVDIRDDGSQILYSYNTPVCVITKDGEVKLLRKGYLGWFSSPTTLRHVKEFLKQNGKEVGTKAQLYKMYSTEDAYNYVK